MAQMQSIAVVHFREARDRFRCEAVWATTGFVVTGLRLTLLLDAQALCGHFGVRDQGACIHA